MSINTKSSNSKSKFLAYVLRHNPSEFGIELADGGWAPVETLLSKCDFTMDELTQIVDNDKKTRYSFNNDKTMIRANQGHSIPDLDMQFNEISPPDVLYHGSYNKVRDLITKEGIKKMDRQHVHMTTDMLSAIKVGSRRGKPILIEIDAKKMADDGIKFYCSTNGIWLTEHVESKYFKSVEKAHLAEPAVAVKK